MSTTVENARDLFRRGELATASALAQSLISADGAAALLLLEILVEQGSFAEALRVARQHFDIDEPRTSRHAIATLRVLLAEVWSGADAERCIAKALQMAGAARGRGDSWLEAFAEETIAKIGRYMAALREEAAPDAVERLRRSVQAYAAAGDARSAMAAEVRLAATLAPSDRDAAARLLGRVQAGARSSRDLPLYLSAGLQFAADHPASDDRDLDALLTLCRDAAMPLFAARVLRQKAERAFERGESDEEAVKEALAVFTREGAAIDLYGFLTSIGEAMFRMGRFAATEQVARQSLQIALSLPFPYGEASPRLMIASALAYQGKLSAAAAEFERIAAIPHTYRHRRYLALLPGCGVLMRANRPDRAAALAEQYVAELQHERPSSELAQALHYLATANVELRRWPEVYAALHRSATIYEQCGEVVRALRMRAERAEWTVLAWWTARQPVPTDAAQLAHDLFTEIERRLETIKGKEADDLRMSLLQMRASTSLALSDYVGALEHLQTLGELASRLGARIHANNVHIQSGLLLHDLAQRGNVAAARAAQPHLDAALAFQREVGAADAVATAAYHAAANRRVLAHRSSTTAEAMEHASAVIDLLREAEQCLSSVLSSFDEPGAEQSENARMAMHASWRKIYDLAVEFFLFDVGDARLAFEWSERWKGRTLAMSLGTGPLQAPEGIPRDWLVSERDALEMLARASSYVDVMAARQNLEHQWARLRTISHAADYVLLRSGAAIVFDELRALLAGPDAHSQSPRRTNGAQ